MRLTGTRRILLAGGSGFVGRGVTAALVARDHIVTWITRRPNRVRAPAGANLVSWDELRARGMGDWDTVCNVAGSNVLNFAKRWTPKFQKEVRDSRIGVTEELVQAILRTPAHKRPKTYIGISGVGYYPYSQTQYYDEEYVNDEPRGDFMEDLVRDWENASKPLEATPEAEVRRVIVRSGVVLGRDGGAFAALYWPFFFGLGGPYGSGEQPFPWIHQYDLSMLFAYAVEDTSFQGVINGTAFELVTNRAVTAELARQMRRPHWLPFPASVLNLLLSPDRANMLLKGQVVVPERLVHLRFPARFWMVKDAIEDLLQ